MATRLKILEVFNRYRLPGGEEHAAARIRHHLRQRHEVAECRFDSDEWLKAGAPTRLAQAARLFYNPEGKRRFDAAIDAANPDLAVFHNVYPVGSPAVYFAARQRRLPVVQFLHNYRPFSVGGNLYLKGRVLAEPLHGNYLSEVREGAWMGSVSKSALMALVLMWLHRSRWLDSVKIWIAISDFMRERLINSGAVRPDRIVTLRHAWDAMPHAPEQQDAGYYLFMGRLVPEKGVPELLDAWDALHAQLRDRTPSLHLCGEGPLAALVTERAKSNPYLCPLGQVAGATKTEQYNRCRAVVIPSVWWEPLGLVTYEAYDHAKPVLAARAGGLTETVIQDVTGLTHEPGRADEIVRDVLTMEATPGPQRAALGAAGRNWLLRAADPGRWLRDFEEIAQRALKPAPDQAKTPS
jgi:glycosyltransferase involved in cell wall biosynthesis